MAPYIISATNQPPKVSKANGDSGTGIKLGITNTKFKSYVDTDGTNVFANPGSGASTQQWYLASTNSGYTYESVAHTTWYLNPSDDGKTLALKQTAYVWSSNYDFTNEGNIVTDPATSNALSLSKKDGHTTIDIVNPDNTKTEQDWEYDF